ncbi:MAG TPA: prepilin-type N-terminal cleavage/methylation domain-containing protein [Luteolibacter sp.]|nr:prepilin-type N-terminal cleavage/methylation domain-containing protein [Luteolibacter sp.]
MKPRGFTLTELLITLAVVAALAGVAYPVGRSMLAKSREAACHGQLRSLGVALQGYLQDHQQTLPDINAGRSSRDEDVAVLETVLLPYLESQEAFKCPQDREEYISSGSSYAWNSMISGQRITQLEFLRIDENRTQQIPLIFDKESWHPSGANILYADMTSANQLRFTAGN